MRSGSRGFAGLGIEIAAITGGRPAIAADHQADARRRTACCGEARLGGSRAGATSSLADINYDSSKATRNHDAENGRDMSDYDTDILLWSERQAALLRRRAAGELVNEAELDWPNIAEEIASVGNEQLHALRSLLVQALVHMLKADAWPLSREVPHWQSEARRFLGDAADRFAPSMRQRIELARLYRRAVRILPETIDSQPPLPVPDVCPVTLDELLSDDP